MMNCDQVLTHNLRHYMLHMLRSPTERCAVEVGRSRLQNGDVAYGSWLRDNALTRSATVHDPVNVVRHGRFEQFLPLDDQDLP